MATLPLLAALAAFLPAVGAPDSSFLLTAQHRESTRTITLTCGPAGGTHPRAEQACEALGGVDGEIAGMAQQSVVCTLEYDPVTVEATGLWHGRERRFTATFPNRCAMRAETGPVFDF
ncbi:SSI family serine proteinase inhibitor [Saccharothrix australiensis]|uniref:Subtilisin inhibitor-like n=1 Tax=Saccharothrix australiensis TaxID=2072 RepID=A0A495W9N0_9PSEU|nr:SSI family serine proteinase inhibitor [Saccharothrix australiensis]RKT57403.1 subtilisin inhibitor-like [Saccharothrix australiensis]